MSDTEHYSDLRMCYYVPGQTHIVDMARSNGNTAIFNTPREVVEQEHPGVQLVDFDTVAWPQIEAASYTKYISAPVEITKERWWEMLEILPPVRWRSDSSSESFMISEALTLDIRSIYCRIGDRYFEMTDRQSLTHQEIVAKCAPLLNLEKVNENQD